MLTPSKKILLVEWLQETPPKFPDGPHQSYAFVDAHAESLAISKLLERSPPDHAYPNYSSYPSIALSVFPAFYTLDGVRGRDFE